MPDAKRPETCSSQPERETASTDRTQPQETPPRGGLAKATRKLKKRAIAAQLRHGREVLRAQNAQRRRRHPSQQMRMIHELRAMIAEMMAEIERETRAGGAQARKAKTPPVPRGRR